MGCCTLDTAWPDLQDALYSCKFIICRLKPSLHVSQFINIMRVFRLSLYCINRILIWFFLVFLLSPYTWKSNLYSSCQFNLCFIIFHLLNSYIVDRSPHRSKICVMCFFTPPRHVNIFCVLSISSPIKVYSVFLHVLPLYVSIFCVSSTHLTKLYFKPSPRLPLWISQMMPGLFTN